MNNAKMFHMYVANNIETVIKFSIYNDSLHEITLMMTESLYMLSQYISCEISGDDHIKKAAELFPRIIAMCEDIIILPQIVPKIRLCLKKIISALTIRLRVASND